MSFLFPHPCINNQTVTFPILFQNMAIAVDAVNAQNVTSSVLIQTHILSVHSCSHAQSSNSSSIFYLIGYYEASATVDLGSVQTSKCSYYIEYAAVDSEAMMDDILDFDAVLLMDGNAQNVGIIPQINLSQNGIAWDGWTNFIAGNYIAQEINFRIKAYSTKITQYLEITELDFIVDMPDRVEGAGDVVIPAIGDTITFSKAFMIHPRIGITIQEASAGDYYYLSAVSETDFTIMIKDSGGAGIIKTISWEARGY